MISFFLPNKSKHNILPSEHSNQHDGYIGPKCLPLLIMAISLPTKHRCKYRLFEMILGRWIFTDLLWHDLEECEVDVGEDEDQVETDLSFVEFEMTFFRIVMNCVLHNVNNNKLGMIIISNLLNNCNINYSKLLTILLNFHIFLLSLWYNY